MDSFELNKILGANSRHLPCSPGHELHRQRAFRAQAAGEAGLRIAVKEAAPSGKEAAPAPSEPIEKLLQTASVEKGLLRRRNAPPAIPSRRAAPTASGLICTASSATIKARDAGSISPPR